MINFKPLGRRLYVELNPVGEKKTAAGLYITERHSELTRVGVVKAKGPDCEQPIEVGDKVLMSFHAGVVIDSTEQDLARNDCHRIMNEDEALAVIEKG